MANWDRTRTPGEPMSFPAEAYNRFVQAARQPRPPAGMTTGLGSGQRPPSTTVLARNDTGGALDRFSVVELSGVVVTRSTDAASFDNRPVLTAIAPTGDNITPWGITAEPIANGRIGPVLIAGLSPVQIAVTTGSEQYAQPASGQTGHLSAAAAGSAQIVHVEGTSGTVWGLVRLGSPVAPYTAPFHGQLIGGGKVEVQAGNVRTPSASASMPAVEYSLSVARYVWVEMSYQPGNPAWTITAGLQNSTTTAPTFWAASGSGFQIQWPIGYINALGQWVQQWRHDVDLVALGWTGSLEVVAGPALQLENDEDSPGNIMVYGTNASGVKGWYGLVELMEMFPGRNAYVVQAPLADAPGSIQWYDVDECPEEGGS